ncbi:MAG TPA: DUF1223 domain-containing protein [Candidatus Deferrimicrobiaceae bacterium]|jgi:hypothetical protein|nr:DUF1223 domain-containing protein [Candidatus Deferrimicrobiaceae bacterium]
MSKFAESVFAAGLTFVVIFFAFHPHATTLVSAGNTVRNPVVVELFTSEGCSSCPPADLLLQKLVQQQPIADAEVIALEEHVDYWNHDGWVDPYSSSLWTDRQQRYAAVFKDDPYTPEAVVNGRIPFVGNNRREAETEIEKAAGGLKTEVRITPLSTDEKGSERFHVSVEKLEGNAAGDVAEVWLAVTEDGLHSAVSRGENAGHVLQHVATLRSLGKIGIADAQHEASPSFSGDALVKFNPNWKAENLRVAVFVQERKSREIVGAASTRIKG